MKSVFPKDFLWGASTAGHQVEGNTHNQWSVWELAHANELAKHAEHRYGHIPIWPEIKPEATNPNNYVSGLGVDHYHRYEEDFDIVKKLHLNSFRFGIEWSRLEPEEGQWDEAEIEHYRRYIQALNKRGIEPVLNLWHWTEPLWFYEKGAFKKRANSKYFTRYAEKVIKEYGSSVRYVITLNEPNTYATEGYLLGYKPPQERSLWSMLRVYYNLSVAHRKAYKMIKKIHPSMQVGITTQLANIQAKRPHNVIDQFVTKVMRYYWNWWFVNRVSGYQDFLGFNYYLTDYYKHMTRNDALVPRSDVNWYMEPEGLYPLLLRAWTRYKKPIIVAENGVADRHDQYRRWWIEESMVAMERALSEGVDLRGYFHWSLLDNFEWESGWWPQFGLVHVDRQDNFKRTIRPSAKWWAAELQKLSDTGQSEV